MLSTHALTLTYAIWSHMCLPSRRVLGPHLATVTVGTSTLSVEYLNSIALFILGNPLSVYHGLSARESTSLGCSGGGAI